MSIAISEVIQVVAGILSDPGTSSKDHQKIVAKAIDIVKEANFQVQKENERLNPVPVPAPVVAKAPVATSKSVKA